MFTPDEYRQIILETANNRRNWGALTPNDFDHHEHNPLCGDHLRLTLRLGEGGVIEAVGWEGAGCAISQASASLLGEKLVGMRLADALRITRGEVLAQIGLPLMPTRQKCALLALRVLVVGGAGAPAWEAGEG
ncbi:MAG: iron-sulfur cluster assembly scaffold protein [Anaerolineae bacterium]|jgi:nitrogen fixation NifU-like protein|nr:iron-sulfur cluster assembly scaffold protein [Anaerolineae bacterium]